MSKTRIKLLFFLNYAEKNMGGIFLYVFYHCFSGGDCFTIIDHPFGGLTLSHVLLVGRICWAVTCVTMAHLLFVDTSELTNCWWVILTSTKSMLAHTELFWDWETSDQHSCCSLNFTQIIASVGPNELDQILWAIKLLPSRFHQCLVSELMRGNYCRILYPHLKLQF